MKKRKIKVNNKKQENLKDGKIVLTWKSLSPGERSLVEQCLAVRKRAYAPYSSFKVGAIAVSSSGKAYAGCNVESADFTLTTHAEMNAIDSMVAAGETRLQSVVVALSSVSGLPVPCGLCRQKMTEFAVRGDLPVLCVGLGADGKIKDLFRIALDRLLPLAFTSSSLGRKKP